MFDTLPCLPWGLALCFNLIFFFSFLKLEKKMNIQIMLSNQVLYNVMGDIFWPIKCCHTPSRTCRRKMALVSKLLNSYYVSLCRENVSFNFLKEQKSCEKIIICESYCITDVVMQVNMILQTLTGVVFQTRSKLLKK